MATTELLSRRADAKQAGRTKYCTGKPCCRGHRTYRYVASGMCAQCAAESAGKKWGGGWRPSPETREKANKNWNSSSKGALAKEKWKQKDPKRAWAVYAAGGAKSRARLSGAAFGLTSQYVLSITPDSCPVFGTPFSFIGNKTVCAESATLDRITPALGYIPGNVVVISCKANMIKNAYGAADIRRVADWLDAQK